MFVYVISVLLISGYIQEVSQQIWKHYLHSLWKPWHSRWTWSQVLIFHGHFSIVCVFTFTKIVIVTLLFMQVSWDFWTYLFAFFGCLLTLQHITPVMRESGPLVKIHLCRIPLCDWFVFIQTLNFVWPCSFRASMIWIIGEYAERIDNADELLESFLDGFQDENTQVWTC